jgi:asparagine synthase (glutamine-hydrolysing)
VALTGDGADEFFAGYARYVSALRYAQAARMVPNALRRAALASLVSLNGHSPMLRRARRALELLSMDGPARFAALNVFLDRQQKERLYLPSFLAQVHSAAERCMEESYSEQQGTELDRMSHALVTRLLPDDFLVKVDIGTMAHSLEARSPFLDHDLAEFTVKLPARYRLKGSVTKHILKEAFKDYFPPGFLERRKQGFQVPAKLWFKQELKQYAVDRILHGGLTKLDVLNMETVAQVLAEHESGRANHETRIWNLLVLSLWTENYVR